MASTALVVHNGNGKAPVLNRQEQIAVLSNTLHRLNQARLWGEMYDGDRKLQQVGGYPTSLTYTNYAAMYEREPLAKRVIDMVSDDTWREPPEVQEAVEGREADSDATKFELAWQEIAGRLSVWRKFARADRLAQLGRYSVIVIGAGAGDDAALQSPIASVDAAGVLYLSVYDEAHAEIPSNGWDVNPASPRFGLPEFYDIDLSSGVAIVTDGQRLGRRRVHHSRVLHVAEDLTADDVFGTPALQCIYNALHDLQKVSTSTAEAFWQRVAGILVASIVPGASGGQAVLEQLDEDMQAIFHDLRRYFIGEGVDLKRLAESEPNPAEAFKLYATLIAAGRGVPFRMLVGNETGERASSEDASTYLGKIAGRQKQHAEPALVRAFVDRLIGWGALPRVEYEVAWPPLFEESALEKADANQKTAASAQALTPVGGDPQLLIEVDKDGTVKLIAREAGAPSPFEQMLEEQKDMEREAMEQKAEALKAAPTQEAA